MSEIEYFYSAHSAYAYLGSARLMEMARVANRRIAHRPMDLRKVVAITGRNEPLRIDLERLAAVTRKAVRVVGFSDRMHEWMTALKAGDYLKGMELLKPLLPVFSALFVESNPIPVKGAASQLGLMEARYRLPLVAPAESTMHQLQDVLQPFR